MESPVRAFLAIVPPPQIRAFLVRVQTRLCTALAGELPREARLVRVAPEAMHLTLRFLGDILPEQEAAVVAAMNAEIAAPFALALSGVGGAPKPRAPRVLWAEPASSEALHLLESALSVRLAAAGFASEEQPFRPHITLARVKWPKRPRPMSQNVTVLYEAAWDEAKRDEKGVEITPAFEVYTYSLFGSRLTPEGPVYTIRHTVSLQGPPGGG